MYLRMEETETRRKKKRLRKNIYYFRNLLKNTRTNDLLLTVNITATAKKEHFKIRVNKICKMLSHHNV